MSQELGTALIAAGALIVGSGLTYLGLRSQLKESRKQNEKKMSQELNAAQLTYLEAMQEKLGEMGQRLISAADEHTRTVIGLERDKYRAEEKVRTSMLETERIAERQKEQLMELRMLSDDQDLEIKKYLAKEELLKGEIRRLNDLLIMNGIPSTGGTPLEELLKGNEG